MSFSRADAYAYLAAVIRGDLEAVTKVLQNNIDVDFKFRHHGDTALIVAAAHGRLAIVQKLSNFGASINAMGSNNTTALISAAAKGYVDIVAFLMENGADVKDKNQDSDTAVVVAISGGHAATVDFFIDKGTNIAAVAKTHDLMCKAAEKGLRAEIEFLAKRGANVNVTKGGDFHMDRMALLLAAMGGHTDTVEILLNYGAKIDVADTNGETALMFAVRAGHVSTVELLAKRGANFQAYQKNRMNPFGFAKDASMKELLRKIWITQLGDFAARAARQAVAAAANKAEADSINAIKAAAVTAAAQAAAQLKQQQDALSPELHKEFLVCTSIPIQSEDEELLSSAIVTALHEERIDDATALTAQSAALGYSHLKISKADFSTRFTHLKSQLDSRYNSLANAGEAAQCKICAKYRDMLQAYLDLNMPVATHTTEATEKAAPSFPILPKHAARPKDLATAKSSPSVFYQKPVASLSAGFGKGEGNVRKSVVVDSLTAAAKDDDAELTNSVLASCADGAPVSLPFSLVSLWTDSFKNEIGKGAFGSVFAGVVIHPEGATVRLGQGQRVAVKKVDADGIISSFLIDFVGENGEEGANSYLRAIQLEINILSSFHHDNIIRLIGYCLPSAEELQARINELCLVYELAPLGGLNAILLDDGRATDLPWQYRLKVAVGVSKGLCCMHNNVAGSPTYHGDIKAANVALMADYTPKIIDSGLMKYVPDASSSIPMLSLTNARLGTLGYMCPYYSKRAAAVYDAKCEVFSFGIVLLELLTGRLQGYEDNDGQQVFIEETLRDEGTVAADSRVEWPEGFVEDFLQLARDCVAPYIKRLDGVITVMHRLVSISKRYHTPTSMEIHLQAKSNELIMQLQTLQLQNDIRAIREAENTYKCESCFDENIPVSKGVICNNHANRHFFCGAAHNDCFSGMVSSQASDQGSFVRNSHSIVCGCCTALVPSVLSTFDVTSLGRQTNAEALTSYIGAITEVQRCQGLAAMEDQRLQYMDELQKLREAHIEDRAARMKASTERHRLRIIESIITLHCPHCDLAILDFDGCFAVEHRADHDRLRSGCGLYFCGWCLAKFGTNNDCHSHVKACPHNLHPGDLNGTFPSEFNEVHGQRRGLLVRQYLQRNILDAQEREETKIALQRELNDLGITILSQSTNC